MQLSKYFTLEEMTVSQEGARAGLTNAPSAEIIAHLKSSCELADAVRDFLGAAMLVSSGYRSPAINSLIGGVAGSAHLYGYAMDFICPASGSPLEVCHLIGSSEINFDQLIQEGTWVHLSFAPAMRRQILTATFHAGDAATYQSGLS